MPSRDERSRRPDGRKAPSSPTATKRRRWLAVLGTVLVLGAAGLVTVRTLDVGETLAALRRADARLLVAAVVVYASSWPLRGRRYGDVLAPMDRRLDSGFLTLAVLLSQTANLVVPARAGDGLRAYVCKHRADVSYASGVASLTVERGFDLLAVGAIGAVALLALPWTARGPVRAIGDPLDAAPVPWLAAVAALLVLAAGSVATAALALRRRDALTERIRRSVHATAVTVAGRPPVATVTGRLPTSLVERTRVATASVGGGVRAAVADLRTIVTCPRSLALVGAGSLAIWALDAFTAVLVLAAVNGGSPVGLAAVGGLAVAAGNLAKVLPLTQGGLGLYEGAFVAAVVATSPIAAPIALAAAVLDHAIKNGVTLAGGALAAVVLQVSPAAATRTRTPTEIQ